MEKIGLVVDTAGDLPRDIVKEYNIKEVPFYLYFEGEEDTMYKENVTITPEEFYRIMRKKKKHPRTAQPNMEDYLSVFEEVIKEGKDKILVMTLSSKFSGSFQSAVLAKEELKKRYPDVEVEIIDTKSATFGEGIQQITAAKMIRKGVLSFDEIVKKLKGIREKTNVIFTLEDLYFFYLGGRLGKGAALMANLMKVKPIMDIEDGEVGPIEKVRGRKKSLVRIVEIAKERIKDVNKLVIGSPQADCKEDQDFLIHLFRKETGYMGQIYTRIMGTTIGAHPGPGTTGLCFFEEDLEGLV